MTLFQKCQRSKTMTEEQIKQKSKDYAEKNDDVIHPHKLALERAYSTGSRVGITEATKELQEDLEHKKIAIKTRNKRIKNLEAQIEKMKCCNNCKYRCYMDWKSKCCFDMSEIRDIENPVTCKCEKWELAE